MSTVGLSESYLSEKRRSSQFEWIRLTNLNSHLLPLFISYRSIGEKLIKYQAHSSCVIMSVILMTTLFYKALILQGEI